MSGSGVGEECPPVRGGPGPANHVSDDLIDLVGAGFDAGVQLGEAIEQDMAAVPLAGPQRQVAVAAPVYIETHGMPQRPRDLVHHRCIVWRSAPGVVPYRWEFSKDGRDYDVALDSQVTPNDLRVMRTALAGDGITFSLEENFAQWV